MAFFKMNPLIFRKEDASSCLVPDKTWADIIDKPDMFEQLADRVLSMVAAADKVQLLDRNTAFRIVKETINDVIVSPLTSSQGENNSASSSPDSSQTDRTSTNVVFADAFWDEIGNSEEFAEKMKAAIEKAYGMKQRIAENTMLSDDSTLQDVKNLVNSAVLNPLQGADKGE